MKKNNGFTLVEILTTIAIIGILSVIAVSSVMMISNSIKEREYNSKIELLSTAAELYAQDHKEIFGVSTENCPSLVLSEACVRVEDLIQNNYAEIDVNQGDKCTDTYGCVINPVNNSSLNKEYFLIKKIKKVIDAELSGTPSINYTLTINPVDGDWEGERIQSLLPGDEISLDNPQKTGCSFKKWKIEGSVTIKDEKYIMGAGDSTLTAEYICNKLIVDANGGIWSGQTTQNLVAGARTTVNNPSKSNCTFVKWNIVGTGTLFGTTFTMGEGDTTLTAQYACNKLIVDANNGIWSGQTTQYLVDGGTTTINNPSKSNCAFVKWNIITGSGTMSGTTFKIGTENATIKAEYMCTLLSFAYTGSQQSYKVASNGDYTIELWGASGAPFTYSPPGKGGYTKGTVSLSAGNILYFYVGGEGNCDGGCTTGLGGWNGGGNGGRTDYCNSSNPSGGGSTPAGSGGGGGTDVRFGGTALSNRIMVAGAGGTRGYNGIRGDAGGLIGYTAGADSSASQLSTGGTQSSGGKASNFNGDCGSSGSLGQGGVGQRGLWYYDVNYGARIVHSGDGGGGGYYGGGGSGNKDKSGTGGGSSYISGHGGCTTHSSGKTFTDTLMIDGRGYKWTTSAIALQQMPNPEGGYYASGIGRVGDGYARISYIDK